MSTVPTLSAEQARWQRFCRVGLHTPFTDAASAAAALMGVQAQILPAAGLALWNRTPNLTHAAFDDLLYTQRTLVKLWGQRGTLHVYATDDWPTLFAARSMERTWWERQAARSSVAATHAALLAQVAELLHARGSLGRSDLRASDLPLTEEHLSGWGGVFADLVRLGHACHGPRTGGEARIVARTHWLPDLDWSPPDPRQANAMLALRYFRGYGPGSLPDFRYWRGARLDQARPWMAPLLEGPTPALAAVSYPGLPSGQTAWLPHNDVEDALTPPPPPEAWPVRMLFRFDPYLLAHGDKDWVVPTAHYKAVWRPAGHIEGVVLAHGQAAATWRYTRKGRGLHIQVTPFYRLPAYVSRALPARAAAVAQFFDLPLADLEIQPVPSRQVGRPSSRKSSRATPPTPA
jgi:hypothetical protein